MRWFVFVFMVLLSFATFGSDRNSDLEIGDKAVLTDLKMTDVTGKYLSLNDAMKRNGLVVLFSCNKCPFVLLWENRFDEVKDWADKNEVGMIVLNSNYQKRNGDDSFEAMKVKAKDKAYRFSYVLDKESKVANTFGGKTTPHVFLFDGDFKLVYKGAIDDNPRSKKDVQQHYIKDAIFSVGAGEKVAIAETKPVGCGIKRKVD